MEHLSADIAVAGRWERSWWSPATQTSSPGHRLAPSQVPNALRRFLLEPDWLFETHNSRRNLSHLDRRLSYFYLTYKGSAVVFSVPRADSKGC